MSIDDTEAHYLKVIIDELFGRRNFVASIAWQKVFAKKNKALISGSHDHVLLYAKDIDRWQRNLIPRTASQVKEFKNPDNDVRGPWRSVSFSVQSEDSSRRAAYRYSIRLPSGRSVKPPSGRHWNGLMPKYLALVADNRVWFGPEGNNPPREKVFLAEVQSGIVPDTWWKHEDAGNNQEGKKEILDLFEGVEPFATPKPERLIQRVIQISTDPGDLVLDSFLGSGTTAAVAHKMERRYIGIEIGAHAVSHSAPRLKKVVNGEQGGISEAVGWKGGGGFRFYRLGPPVFGADGCIRSDIPFSLLAAHVWFSETGQPWDRTGDAVRSPFLGVHDGCAYALLYNGVLGDRRSSGGNVLTHATLTAIRNQMIESMPGFRGPLTVFGESSRLTARTLSREAVVFRQIPYEVKARA